MRLLNMCVPDTMGAGTVSVLFWILGSSPAWRALEKTLMLGGIGGRRRRGQQRMRWLDGMADSMDMPCRVGTGESGLVLSEEGNPAGLSSCSAPRRAVCGTRGSLRTPQKPRTQGVGSVALPRPHAIQPSHPLLSPFPPAPNPSQHQSLFQ